MTTENRVYAGAAMKRPDFPEASENREAENRIARLREALKRGGGNTTVAKAAGIPISTLNTYLSGTEMKLSSAAAIAAVCGVTVDWLSGGDQMPFAELFRAVDIDQLAEAIDYTDRAFARRAGAPTLRERAQAICITYDLLSAQKAGEASAKSKNSE